jgi:hypothetical protein
LREREEGTQCGGEILSRPEHSWQVRAVFCVRKCGRMYLTICGRAISLARPKLPIGSTRGHLALTRTKAGSRSLQPNLLAITFEMLELD